MMEKDDKILKDFFAANKLDIADNGFSDKVMKNLPQRANPLVKMWGAFILLATIIIFYLCDGWLTIIQTLRDIFVNIAQKQDLMTDPFSYIIAAVVLVAVIINRLYSYD